MIKLKKQLYKRIQKQISIKRMRIKFEKKKKQMRGWIILGLRVKLKRKNKCHQKNKD
jgi:septum formation topological specificity factor MinE